MIRKILLGTLAGLAFTGAALAQAVNVVPQVGMISEILRRPTYTASSVGLVVIGGTAGTAITMEWQEN